MDKLLQLTHSNQVLNETTAKLIATTKLALEKEIAPSIPVTIDFIIFELERLENYAGKNILDNINDDSLNALFHRAF